MYMCVCAYILCIFSIYGYINAEYYVFSLQETVIRHPNYPFKDLAHHYNFNCLKERREWGGWKGGSEGNRSYSRQSGLS